MKYCKYVNYFLLEALPEGLSLLILGYLGAILLGGVGQRGPDTFLDFPHCWNELVLNHGGTPHHPPGLPLDGSSDKLLVVEAVSDFESVHDDDLLAGLVGLICGMENGYATLTETLTET